MPLHPPVTKDPSTGVCGNIAAQGVRQLAGLIGEFHLTLHGLMVLVQHEDADGFLIVRIRLWPQKMSHCDKEIPRSLARIRYAVRISLSNISLLGAHAAAELSRPGLPSCRHMHFEEYHISTLTACRRLIIRDEPQAASKYIADYIIGGLPTPLHTLAAS